MGGTNSRPKPSLKLDQITKSGDHFDPLSILPVCFIYLGFDPNLSVAQKPIGLRLAEAEKDPTLPVPLKGKFEPNLGQWECRIG